MTAMDGIQTREAARLSAIASMFAESRGLPIVYARADVQEILQAAALWDAEQDTPTVRDIADILAGHSVKPTGMCTCGVQVNDGKAKGLDRSATLNRHRAVVLAGAGYRWAPDLEWEWAAVGPRERARGIETYTWTTEEGARSLGAKLVAHATHPVVLVRRTPAGMLEEVERWIPAP